MSTVQFLAKSGAVGIAAALAGAMLCACDAGAGSRAAMMAQTPAAAQPGEASPVIPGQPHPLPVKDGESAMFPVTGAMGGAKPQPSYQWQRNGVDIPGATRDYLLLLTATLADDGARYTVVVRNGVGRVVSRPGLLAVVSADTELPRR